MVLASVLYNDINTSHFAEIFTWYLPGLHLLFLYSQFIAVLHLIKCFPLISSPAAKEGNKSAHAELCVTKSRLL